MHEKRRASHSPFSILHFTIYHCHRHTHKRCHNRRSDNPCRIHTPILPPVSWCQVRTKKYFNFFSKIYNLRLNIKPPLTESAKKGTGVYPLFFFLFFTEVTIPAPIPARAMIPAIINPVRFRRRAPPVHPTTTSERCLRETLRAARSLPTCQTFLLLKRFSAFVCTCPYLQQYITNL